jgi:hypothetical protein
MWINVKVDHAAAGDGTSDDTTEIQAAIDAAATAGGGFVYFPSGTYLTGTLTQPSGVYLIGEGRFASILKAKNSLNGPVIKTDNFSTQTGGNKWFVDTENVRWGFGLLHLQIQGNKANQTSGNGVSYYGKGWIIDDVLIRDCKDVGLFSEAGSGSGQHDYRDAPEAFIGKLWVHSCGSHGVQYRGPHDGVIESLITFSNGSDGIRFEYSANTYSGLVDAKYIHSYGNGQYGIYSNVRIKGTFLQGETNTREGIYFDTGASQSQVIHMEAFGNDSGDSSTYWNIFIASAETQVEMLRAETTNASAGGVKITGADCRINNSLVKEGVTPTGTTSAIGADLDANGITYKGKISGFNGTTATGLRDSNGGSRSSLNLDVFVENCKTHWNHVTAGNRGLYKVVLFSSVSGQTMYTGAAPDTSGRESWIVRGANSADTTTQLSIKSGSAIITSGTSVAVTHGLIATPKNITLTRTNVGGALYVTSIGSTTFTVNGALNDAFDWTAAIHGGA